MKGLKNTSLHLHIVYVGLHHRFTKFWWRKLINQKIRNHCNIHVNGLRK